MKFRRWEDFLEIVSFELQKCFYLLMIYIRALFSIRSEIILYYVRGKKKKKNNSGIEFS